MGCCEVMKAAPLYALGSAGVRRVKWLQAQPRLEVERLFEVGGHGRKAATPASASSAASTITSATSGSSTTSSAAASWGGLCVWDAWDIIRLVVAAGRRLTKTCGLMATSSSSLTSSATTSATSASVWFVPILF